MKSTHCSMNRRAFLRRTLAGAGTFALPVVVPRTVLGAPGAASPGNRVTLACIGLGNRGPDNLRAFLPNAEARVVAVCDVHATQLAVGKRLVDDHYGNRDCAVFRDYRELLARKDLDAVLICTPDHWHPLVALEAARQRKHLYCEKPMGWSVRAGQAVRTAVHDRGVIFQFGTQQRSDAKFRQACELVRNGRIGQLNTILVGVPGSVPFPNQPTQPVPAELDYDLWLGPELFAPYSFERCRPFTSRPNLPWTQNYSTWYHISDYCIGFIGNWGIHHLDIAQWGNGSELTGPTQVEGTGTFPTGGLADCALTWQVQNRFANGVTVVHMDDDTSKRHPPTCCGCRLTVVHMDDDTSKRHPQQVGGFGHGVTFLGSEGWVHVRRGYIEARPASLLETRFGQGDLRLPRSDHHHNNFIDAVKGRAQPVSPVDVAVRSDTLCWLDQIAIRLGRKLRWDPAKESFVDDPEADRMLDRLMRAPWKLEA